MITLDSSIKTAPGVGPAVNKHLNRVGVKLVRDLLFYFPFRYIDFSKFTTIKDVKPGEIITIRGFIKTIQARYSFRGRVSLCEAIISDETGSIKVIWFNQPYLAKSLKSGDEVLLSGKADVYKTLQLQNPVYEKAADETIHTGRIVPVYRLTEGLYNRTVRNLVNKFLPLADTLPEILPRDLLHRYSLPALPQAIRQIHFPDSDAQINAARERVIFEEVLIQQLAVQQHKLLLKKLPAPKIARNVELIKSFLSTLPFELTLGQKQALWQIMKDLDRDHPMNRLLEGDVGSGKTLVALMAMLEAVAAGYQTVLIAPTEILAKQHYETFIKALSEYRGHEAREVAKPIRSSEVSAPKETYEQLRSLAKRRGNNEETEVKNGAASAAIKIGLLTSQFQGINGVQEMNGGSSKRAERRAEIISQVKSGQINIIIGTHALFSGDVAFKNLALVVIDEQHRFGVQQRAVLLRKAGGGVKAQNSHIPQHSHISENSQAGHQQNAESTEYQTPHLLSMSATPIPRTLALSFYGDLDISTLPELPKGRQKIETKIVAEADRDQAYQFIKKELRASRQAFVITPRVEESATNGLISSESYAEGSAVPESPAAVKSVKQEFKRLSEEVFPEFKPGLLYGKMKGSEKDKTMAGFNAGKLDLLVASSVIEIGIDVPNATVMLIEGAERFGLAQLHQLRGRVGRGSAKSYCFLFLTDETSESRQRLEEFARSHDGFKLAELDLKQRGMGSLFGTEQTGFAFKFGQFLSLKILAMAKEAAQAIIKTDPELKKSPQLKQKVEPLISQIHLE